MKKKMIVGVVAASLLGFGCQPSSTPPASTSSPAAQATTAATTAPDATATPETTGTPEAAQGGLPYQFPSNPPAAEPGTFVFVPMASSLERLTIFGPGSWSRPVPKRRPSKTGKSMKLRTHSYSPASPTPR